MRYLILPAVMVSLALHVAGCALSFDLDGTYRGVVDPSKIQGAHSQRLDDREELRMLGFTRDNPYPKEYKPWPMKK